LGTLAKAVSAIRLFVGALRQEVVAILSADTSKTFNRQG
jgi:hypothetical protein